MIPKYAEWISSIVDFLQKSQKFEWGPDQVLRLAKLKKNVTNRPLVMYDPENKIELQTNVSDKTIRAMEFQQRKPLDYYLKKMIPAETDYTTGNKKMIAIIIALKLWRY